MICWVAVSLIIMVTVRVSSKGSAEPEVSSVETVLLVASPEEELLPLLLSVPPLHPVSADTERAIARRRAAGFLRDFNFIKRYSFTK